MVLVDAPEPTIISCLAGLNQDAENYVGVAVDEPAEIVDRVDANEQLKKKFAVDLRQYNRGIVSQQQKDAFDDPISLSRIRQRESEVSRKGDLGAIWLPRRNRKSNMNESEMKRLQSMAAENRGRALRLPAFDGKGDLVRGTGGTRRGGRRADRN